VEVENVDVENVDVENVVENVEVENVGRQDPDEIAKIPFTVTQPSVLTKPNEPSDGNENCK
jgi:hypothetical protein